MQKQRRALSLIAGLAGLVLVGEAPAFDFNKNVDIEAGTESGGHSSVNGSIDVGAEAIVNGELETVNGSIRIDDNAQVRDLETVNGRIRLGSGVTAGAISSVNGTISADARASADSISVVNGKIRLDPGVQIASDVGNVNGEIEVTGAEIGGDLSTVNGDVSLTENARLRGDLVVEKPGGFNWNDNKRQPRVVVGPGTRVDGEIVLEREVELFISETAQVGGVTGVMSMDDAVRFSGNRP